MGRRGNRNEAQGRQPDGERNGEAHEKRNERPRRRGGRGRRGRNSGMLFLRFANLISSTIFFESEPFKWALFVVQH